MDPKNLIFHHIDGEPSRKCGDCTLCCKLMPVEEIGKLASHRCPHQRSKGCTIYTQRPDGCREWHCRWLVEGDSVKDLRRPDRSHYVLDIVPDIIEVQDAKELSEFRAVPVVQIWLDPAFPEAYKDPALKAYLAEMGRTEKMAALIRTNSKDAFVLMPPCMMADHEWYELRSNLAPKISD